MLQSVLLGVQFVEVLLNSLTGVRNGTSGKMVAEFSSELDGEKLDLKTKRITKARKTPRKRNL